MKVFGSVRYYLGHGVVDPAYPFMHEPGGPVSRSRYENWAKEHAQTGATAAPISLRLIHAHETAPDVFAELKSRVGREGLGLLGDIRVLALDRAGTTVPKPRYYDVVFEPIDQKIELSLGQLSGGTRQMLYLMLAQATSA